MSAFSSYAFNKSHAAAYSFVSYQTAYLKCHYPKEYMSALMTSMQDDTDKIGFYTGECKRMGIKVLPPHVNESFEGFTPVGEGIRFGLSAIKNIGGGFVASMLRERKNGNFISMYDFCLRNSGRDFNRRTLEGLIKSGALDRLELNRRTMLKGADALLQAVDDRNKFYGAGQMDLFGEEQELQTFNLEPAEEMPVELLLAMEKEATGLYLSGHPMEAYSRYASAIKAPTLRKIQLGEIEDGQRVTIVVMLTTVKTRSIKNDGIMVNITAEDITGSIGITAFNRTVTENRHLITEGNILAVTGRIQEREDRPFEMVAERFETIPKSALTSPPQKKVKSGLYLRVKSLDAPEMEEIKSLLAEYLGDIPVYVVLSDGKKLLAPKNLWVSFDTELISSAEKILSKENVKFVE